ncbi:hypothetical protein [Cupriavidus sp. WS]|uniref:hypothetical protein n=1 Tax=Cupriavidus sp. WS TaxID=1312922 RepID=UPI0003A0B1CD|nr:hypothetical protein [Cupriavidus sp. WS]
MPRFAPDMLCCKPARATAGLVCERRYQLGCAWRNAERIAQVAPADRAWRALQAFASHLLGECAWPLSHVFWSFQAAGQLSALAQVCAQRWCAIPTKEGRAAYAAEVAAATAAYRVETGAHMAAAFLSTFHVLCEAATARP